MEKPYHEKTEISVKIEVPELIVEWQESDSTYEFNAFDSYCNPQQIPNYIILMFKFHRWKMFLHNIFTGIFISIFLMFGILCLETYGPIMSKPVFDITTLENIYTSYIINDNTLDYIILNKDGLVLFETTITNKMPYQNPGVNRKIHWYLTEDNELFFLSNKESQMVTNNVIEFIPSRDNMKVFYIKKQGDDFSLHEYKLESGLSTLIDNNVIERDFCISPDGNTIVYNKPNDDGDITETYIYAQGEKQFKGINIIPIAISDEGTLFYYVKNQNLLVEANRGKTQLMTVENNELSNLILIFNQDHKELQYLYNDSWYQSSYGATGIKLNQYDTCSKIYQNYEIYENNWYSIRTFSVPHLSIIEALPQGHIFKAWIKKVKNFQYGIILENRLYCLADKSVYYIDNNSYKNNNVIKVSGDLTIKQFVASSDFNYCFMLTNEGDLYQLDSNGKRKLCLDNVERIYRNYEEGKEEFYFTRYDPLSYLLSSNYNYQLWHQNQLSYRKEDNTIVRVEEADNIILYSYPYHLLYKKTTDQTDQYYMLNEGKSIKVTYPDNKDIN